MADVAKHHYEIEKQGEGGGWIKTAKNSDRSFSPVVYRRRECLCHYAVKKKARAERWEVGKKGGRCVPRQT